MIGFVLVLLAVLVLAFVASSVRMIRAESAEEQARAQKVIAGCIIGGLIIAIAPFIAEWLTGLKDYTSDDGNIYYYTGDTITTDAELQAAIDAGRSLPRGMGDVVAKVLGGLKILGGIVLIAGAIYGGIQYRYPTHVQMRR